MGKKQGKNWRGTGKNWEGPGKNLEGTGKDQRSELHHATNLLSIQFGSTYMQQCIYYFMLSVSVLDQVGSNLSTFSNVFNMFLFNFFTLILGVHFCVFWVPHEQKRFKRGLRVILLESKS